MLENEIFFFLLTLLTLPPPGVVAVVAGVVGVVGVGGVGRAVFGARRSRSPCKLPKPQLRYTRRWGHTFPYRSTSVRMSSNAGPRPFRGGSMTQTPNGSGDDDDVAVDVDVDLDLDLDLDLDVDVDVDDVEMEDEERESCSRSSGTSAWAEIVTISAGGARLGLG